MGGPGLVDLPLGGVGGAGQPPQRALGCGQHLLQLAAVQAGGVGLGVGLEGGQRLVEGAHAGEAVAAHQVVVQKAQRQAGHEGVNPHGQTGQLHRHLVAVHAVDAVPGHLAAQQRAGLDLHPGGQIAQSLHRRLVQPSQLGGHRRDRVQGQPARQPGLDPVQRGHQEVARAHGDVGAAEVEEGVGQRGVVSGPAQLLQPGDVVVQRRFQRVVEQMPHRERLGEVGAGGFAGSGPVVYVHRPGFDLHRVAARGRDVFGLALDLLHGEVALGHRQPRLQQALVDGAEFPHRQRPEVHRPLPLGAVVDQQPGQRRGQLGVGEPQLGQGRAGFAHRRVVGEEAAVVGGHPPAGVAPVDRGPELLHVVPQRRGPVVVALPAGAAVLGQAAGHALQGVVGVVVVGAVGEQVLVLGVGHEQQSEQDHHHLLVGVVEGGVVGVAAQPAGHGFGQSRHRLEVDPLPQPHGQLGREVGRAVEDLPQRPVLGQGVGGEQQVQVAG